MWKHEFQTVEEEKCIKNNNQYKAVKKGKNGTSRVKRKHKIRWGNKINYCISHSKCTLHMLVKRLTDYN